MKKLILGVIIFFIFQPSIASDILYNEIQSLGKAITENIANESKLAITELVDLEGNPNSLGKFIAEELITSISMLKGKNITVIERRLLMKVLEEQKLSTSDLLEPEAIKKLHKLLGAEYIITGSITELGDEVRINARVISTTTGEIASANRATIPATGLIKKLMEQRGKGYLSVTDPKDIGSENALITQNWQGVDIKLLGCSKVSESIQCKLVITSTKKDIVFYLYSKTALFDNNGNKAAFVNAQYGNSAGTAIGSYRNIQQELIAGVPVKTTLSFNLPDKQASKISALKLRVSSSAEVIFRDIPL